MTTMRGLLNLLEALSRPELDEAGAGPSRVVQHIRDGNVFVMLSAMRGSLNHAENLRRTDKLNQMLRNLPVSFIATEGEYQEDGQNQPSPEKSFFVMPRKGATTVSPDKFREFGVKLMHVFDQDSILYGDGKVASLIFDNGSTMDLGDTMTFRPEVIQDLGGFSKVKGRKFSFTDAPTASKPVEKIDKTQEPTKTKGVQYGLDTPDHVRTA